MRVVRPAFTRDSREYAAFELYGELLRFGRELGDWPVGVPAYNAFRGWLRGHLLSTEIASRSELTRLELESDIEIENRRAAHQESSPCPNTQKRV